jgi:hypothetical protein
MVLRENFIAIKNPVYKQSNIELTEEDQRDILERDLEKLDKLQVVEIGPDVKTVKKNDFIYVDTSRILRFPRITLDNVNYLFIRENDVIFRYV